MNELPSSHPRESSERHGRTGAISRLHSHNATERRLKTEAHGRLRNFAANATDLRSIATDYSSRVKQLRRAPVANALMTDSHPITAAESYVAAGTMFRRHRVAMGHASEPFICRTITGSSATCHRAGAVVHGLGEQRATKSAWAEGQL